MADDGAVEQHREAPLARIVAQPEPQGQHPAEIEVYTLLLRIEQKRRGIDGLPSDAIIERKRRQALPHE